MVHQTISSSNTSAARASNKSQTMKILRAVLCRLLIVGALGSGTAPALAGTDGDSGPAAAQSLAQPRSRWIAVPWSELPGFGADSLHEAWNAWLSSCGRPPPPVAALCRDVRGLSIASQDEKQAWMRARLQAYRIESLQGDATGLLTGYFEPEFDASRIRAPGFTVPLYQPPARAGQSQPWYTRQEIDTLAAAKAALHGREIAFLSDPIDALIMQIQGSGRLRLTQADGSQLLVRLGFAGSNEQPYRSVGRWLLDQGAIREASWPAIKAWAVQHPQRLNELLWSNPRTVFFREEPMGPAEVGTGPRGAQGVALTPGRSVAVDPLSVPYGTPLWLSSSGESGSLERLVLAQDTGAALIGAVRVDYFTGWGPQAGELAGRIKQPVRLWALWPK